MIESFELSAYGSLQRPTSDASITGGGIDLSTRVEFADLDVNDYVQLVAEGLSEDVGVVITGRRASGLIESETLSANGRSTVQSSGVFERLMGASKIGPAPLPVAIERKTAVLVGAASGGGVSEIALPSSASSVDGSYVGMLVRLVSGPGAGQVARILGYVGSTRTAYVDARWSTPPTNSTGFRISVGILLRSVISQVVRPFWNAIADVREGSERVFYDKVFLRNDSDELLSDALVAESYNPSGLIKFALDAVVDGTTQSTNRRTAPSLVFDRSPKSIPGLSLAARSAIGVWLELRLRAGQPPVKSVYGLALQGTTT